VVTPRYAGDALTFRKLMVGGAPRIVRYPAVDI